MMMIYLIYREYVLLWSMLNTNYVLTIICNYMPQDPRKRLQISIVVRSVVLNHERCIIYCTVTLHIIITWNRILDNSYPKLLIRTVIYCNNTHITNLHLFIIIVIENKIK